MLFSLLFHCFNGREPSTDWDTTNLLMTHAVTQSILSDSVGVQKVSMNASMKVREQIGNKSFGWFFPRNARLEVLGCRMPRLSIQDLLTCGKNEVHDEKSLKSSSLTVHFLSDTLVSKSTLFIFVLFSMAQNSTTGLLICIPSIISCFVVNHFELHPYIYIYTHNIYTLPETNMAPENVWLEY